MSKFKQGKAVTREWWDTCRSNFEIYVSQVVLDEAARGDPEMAQNRIEMIKNFPLKKRKESVSEERV